jgi:(p)ppGpp synthase/HD superfamily hydrolase
MATLERAIIIAATAHVGTVDKANAPYVLHPLRLMLAMQDEVSSIVAVLHDVVEDSRPPNRWGFAELRAEGFSEEVLAALDCVTRRDEESYEAFIDRCLPNPTARMVKIADLNDNLDIRRIGHELTDKDVQRIRKYQNALTRLKSRPVDGFQREP